MTEIILSFLPGWYVTFAIGLVTAVVFGWFSRYRNFRFALLIGLCSVAFAIVVEPVSIYLNLWNYTGGNWPVILWLSYFVYGISFYYLIKLLERKVKIDRK